MSRRRNVRLRKLSKSAPIRAMRFPCKCKCSSIFSLGSDKVTTELNVQHDSEESAGNDKRTLAGRQWMRADCGKLSAPSIAEGHLTHSESPNHSKKCPGIAALGTATRANTDNRSKTPASAIESRIIARTHPLQAIQHAQPFALKLERKFAAALLLPNGSLSRENGLASSTVLREPQLARSYQNFRR